MRSAPDTAAPGLNSGSVGIRLVDVPQDSIDNPRAQNYVIDRMLPGATIKRRVQVKNLSGVPTSVAVYAAGAAIVQKSFVGLDGSEQNALSRWIHMETPRIQLAPNAEVMDLMTIAVPLDAPPGEQYATIWAEISSTKVTGIIVAERVGLRVYLQVGGANAPGPNFKIGSLIASRTPAGAPSVVATVINTGGRALDISGTVTLSGHSGLNAGPFPVPAGTTIAVGATQPVEAVLDPSVPVGPWLATIKLHSGDLEYSATATISFPPLGTSIPAAPVPAQMSAVPIPVQPHSESNAMLWWLLVGGSTLALLAGGAWRLSWSARRRKQEPDPLIW